ncbi:MAG TPA: hypothetical protein VK508_00660 [Cyclobacteriaceae bacterium]|nr:hypothetical protein [Cyclobacteriaceae bacterium]
MRIELTPEEKQATLDAIDRFKAKDPELLRLYEVEFVLTGVVRDVNDNDLFDFLRLNSIEYTKVTRNGADILLVITMRLDATRLIELESYLTLHSLPGIMSLLMTGGARSNKEVKLLDFNHRVIFQDFDHSEVPSAM